MSKFIMVVAAAALSLSAVSAEAGGWGKKGGNGSLVNVSPSVDVGDIKALNNILSGNVIASGNTVSGILNGNALGVLNGNALGILGGNSYKITKKH